MFITNKNLEKYFPHLDRERLLKISCTSSSLLSFGLTDPSWGILGDECTDSMVASDSLLCNDEVVDCFPLSIDLAAEFVDGICCEGFGDAGKVIFSTDDLALFEEPETLFIRIQR